MIRSEFHQTCMSPAEPTISIYARWGYQDEHASLVEVYCIRGSVLHTMKAAQENGQCADFSRPHFGLFWDWRSAAGGGILLDLLS